MSSWPDVGPGPANAVLAAGRGDEAALQLILRRFAPLVRRMASAAPQSYREDVEEDIRFQLLQAASRFRPAAAGQATVRSDRAHGPKAKRRPGLAQPSRALSGVSGHP